MDIVAVLEFLVLTYVVSRLMMGAASASRRPTVDELADLDCPLFDDAISTRQSLPGHYSMLEVEDRARIAAHLTVFH